MILLCVGASEYKFDRLFKIVDNLCDKGIIDGNEIIAQIGHTNYKPRNYKYFDLIGREDFQKYVEKADLVISHAGTGCVLPPLKLGKKVIVFPRMEKYMEHLDDHQIELCEVFTSAGYTMKAENETELIECIARVEKFSPNTFVSNTKNISDFLISYINHI